MPKKTAPKTKTPRTSAKQKFETYQNAALQYISLLRNPATRESFNIKTYETVPNSPLGKKPNALSAPELAAIVGTAARLGQEVRVSLTGYADTTSLMFEFVAKPSNIPAELLKVN